MDKHTTFLLFAVLFTVLLHLSGFSQEQSGDRDRIRETLTHYIEGRNGGNLERLQKAFHPEAALKFVDPETGALQEWSLAVYLTRLKPGEKQNCTALITDIRLFGNAAQATVLLTYPNVRLHDYMSLLKLNGQWLIVDKIFSRRPNRAKVLIVVTSHADLGNTGRKAGLNLMEVSYVYKALDEAGYAVDFVSPAGKVSHLYGNDMNDSINAWFARNTDAWTRLHQTLTPDQVQPEAYSAIYYAGGHGTMWDFPGNTTLANIATKIYENGGIVAGICHGSIGLLNITLSDGAPLVKGKKVTGFTNQEEKEIKLERVVPMLVETALLKQGAQFVGTKNWASNVQSDQRLITGQNSESVAALAKILLEALESKVLASKPE